MKRKLKKYIMSIRMRLFIRSERDEVSSLSYKIKSYKNSIQNLTPKDFRDMKSYSDDISPINRHDISKLNENNFDKLTRSEDLRKDLSKYGHTHNFTSATPNIFDTSKTVFKFIHMSKENNSTKDDNPDF